MKTRYRILFAILPLLVLRFAPLGAQTIGVAAFQEGPDKAVQPEAFLTPLVSGCMDELFFSGFIATSEKSATLSARDFKDGSPVDREAAKQASVSYEIEILVSVAKSSFSKTLKIPSKAEYRFIDLNNGKIIVQGAILGMEDGEDLQSRIDAWCAQASKTIMPACLGKLTDGSKKVGS
jgi:hypothetical protein